MSTSQHTIEVHKKYDRIAKEAIKMHETMSWKKISEYFNIGKDNFVRYIRNKGYIENCQRNIYYDDDILEKAKELYLDGNSVTKIAEKLGVWRKTLSKDLKQKYSLTIGHDGKKQVNDYYFDKIDTPEKAYWLGFLYADGYVSKGNTIEFCLQDADKERVVAFRDALSSKHKISKKIAVLNGKSFINWKISIKSTQLVNDLIKHGCVRNKTYIVKFPKERKYIWSFLRGYFDGDGCIYISNNHPKISFTCASKDYIYEFKKFLQKNNIKSSISKVKMKENWVLSLYTKSTRIFCDLIYKNSTEKTRMARKYNKYINYCILPSRDKDCKKSLDEEVGIKLEERAKATQSESEGAA